MGTRLIIEGNTVYEIDEDCQALKKRAESGKVVTESWDFMETNKKERKTGTAVRR